MVFTRQVFTYHLSFFMIQIFKFASFILHDIFLSFLFYFDIIFHFSVAFSTWLSLLFTWLLFFTAVTRGQCTHVSRCSRVCTSSSLSLSAALSIKSFRRRSSISGRKIVDFFVLNEGGISCIHNFGQ